MTLRTLQIAILLATACAAPAVAATYDISSEAVVQALRVDGVAVKPSQVQLLSSPVSRGPLPELEVLSVEPWTEGKMKAKIACRDRGDCVPFYVGLRVDDVESVPVLRPKVKAASEREPVVVRTGSAATLLLESGKLQVSFPVVCLENGALGRTIRVSTPDRKRFYKAEVISATLLKGRIER